MNLERCGGPSENKTARTVAFRREDQIKAGVLTEMLKRMIANNRGGWRNLKAESDGPR